jgi:hypothetical protein
MNSFTVGLKVHWVTLDVRSECRTLTSPSPSAPLVQGLTTGALTDIASVGPAGHDGVRRRRHPAHVCCPKYVGKDSRLAYLDVVPTRYIMKCAMDTILGHAVILVSVYQRRWGLIGVPGLLSTMEDCHGGENGRIRLQPLVLDNLAHGVKFEDNDNQARIPQASIGGFIALPCWYLYRWVKLPCRTLRKKEVAVS